MGQDRFAPHNVVATFLDTAGARRAVEEVQEAGVSQDEVSWLSRGVEEAVSEAEVHDDAAEVPSDMGRGAAKGSGVGAAAGGLAGFLAGAAAFGIPGVGPAVGAGIWAATFGGAAAGATAGGVMGGIGTTWQRRAEDSVREGRVLVGVHSDDAAEVDKAQEVLSRLGPERIDRLNAEGEVIGADRAGPQ